MPEERRPHEISEHEHADRVHNAEQHGGTPAIAGDEQIPLEQDTAQDRIARAAGAMGVDTETDPLRLLQYDDRPGQSDRRR